MVSVLLKSDTDVAAARDMDKLRKENGNWGETELCTWKNNGVKWEKKSVNQILKLFIPFNPHNSPLKSKCFPFPLEKQSLRDWGPCLSWWRQSRVSVSGWWVTKAHTTSPPTLAPQGPLPPGPSPSHKSPGTSFGSEVPLGSCEPISCWSPWWGLLCWKEDVFVTRRQ